MKDFVNTKGQCIQQEKIPIKQTLKHLELQANHQLTEQKMSPLQMMKLRKEKLRKEEEEKLKLAAKQNYEFLQSHKQRKFDELKGSLGKDKDFQKSGDDVSSFHLNNDPQTMSTKHSSNQSQEEKTFFEYQQNKFNNQYEISNSNSKCETILTESGLDYSFQINKQQNKNDDIQITQTTPFDKINQKINQIQLCISDDEDEIIEEYNNSNRLTKQSNDDHINQVIEVYKNQINNGKEIDDQKKNLSPAIQSKLDLLKSQCRQALGQDIYKQVYQMILKHRQIGSSKEKITQDMTLLVGQNNLIHCFAIDQIIYLENN